MDNHAWVEPNITSVRAGKFATSANAAVVTSTESH